MSFDMLTSPDSRSPSPEISKMISTSKRQSPPRRKQSSEANKQNTQNDVKRGISTTRYGNIGGKVHYSDHSFKRHIDGTSDLLVLTSEDAEFLLRERGAMKQNITRASGAVLTLSKTKSNENTQHLLTLTGNENQRARARDYIRIALKQRIGKIELIKPKERNDLSLIDIPQSCVGYVAGRNGHQLRRIESDWGVLMFFPKVRCSSVFCCLGP